MALADVTLQHSKQEGYCTGLLTMMQCYAERQKKVILQYASGCWQLAADNVM